MVATEPHQRHRLDERLAELQAELAAAVEDLASSGQWKAWLDVAARFHTYSPNNTILIWAQQPDATMVAGYKTWQQVGRQVSKGERGIQILAPVIKTVRPDDEAARESADGGDADVRPNRERVRVGFRRTYVWDIKQTTGGPLPTAPRARLLEGEAPDDLWDELADQVAAQGYELRRGRCPQPRAKGCTDFVLHTVTIRPDLSDAQAVKTLAHELAHTVLHDPNTTGQPPRACRELVEVEAESVAYLVAKAHGLDTGDYSFPYITGWAASRNLGPRPGEVVQQTATRVLGAAHDILDKLGHQPARPDTQTPAQTIDASPARSITDLATTVTTSVSGRAGLPAGLPSQRARMLTRSATSPPQL